MMRLSNPFLKASLGGAFVCSIALFCTTGYSQTRDRIIEKESWRSEPIKIVKLRTKGGNVEISKKFDGDDDWLRGFTVTVQNASDKAIARIVLRLDFPRAAGTPEDQATYVTRIMLGRDPADSNGESLKLTQPGELTEIKLVEENIPLIRSDLKQLGYPETINRVRLVLDSVTFADGSMWAAGETLYPDPSNPVRKTNPKFPRKGPMGKLWNYPMGLSLGGAGRFQLTAFSSEYPHDRLDKASYRMFPLQTPASAICTTVFNYTVHIDCGESGSG